LPVWQEMRQELKDKNFEVITLDCDVKIEAAREWILAAQPQHPSLLDPRQVVSSLYNAKNVPTEVWINEDGEIVRYDEGVYVRRRNQETGEFTINERYLRAVRDWVENGANSRFALESAEARKRLKPLTAEDAQAATYFRLGVHLYQQGYGEDAVPYFKKARELKPENWNLTRQAFNLGNPEQDYGTTIQKEREVRPMYVPLDMPSFTEA